MVGLEQKTNVMTRPTRRILCLRLPTWPTDRWRRGRGIAGDRPLVTVATIGNRRIVQSVDELAAACGLLPGLTLADARAREPGLEVIEADPAADRAALARLADWASRFSPWVAPVGADALWLDVTGSVPLFASEAALAGDLLARLRRQGIGARAAIADTPGGAWALATYRAGQEPVIVPPGGIRAALAELPVAALRLPVEIAEDLRRLGLVRIESLYGMPRAPLAPRFGEIVARRLDQALGIEDEPISPHPPILPRLERLGFAEPILTAGGIERGIRLLLGRLCRRLEQERLGVRRLELACYRVDAGVERQSIGTSQPNRDPAHLARLLVPCIEQIDPGFGIDLMLLSAPAIEPQGLEQGGLLPRAQQPDDGAIVAPLIDRLANRLGAANVLRIAPADSHVPERAMRLISAFETMPDGDWPTDRPRPIRLLSPPEPIEVMAPLPEDPPLQFRWHRVLHRIRRAEGPERIAPEWWRRIGLSNAPDDLRDYYRIEDEAGRRFWVYRQGIYRPDRRPPWFMHGLFS